MVKLGALDVVFLSYREPQKEQFWAELRRRVPGARRVDGVEGFLDAFKRCAELSATSHFLMVDGDTRLLDSFDPALELPRLSQDVVLTWASRNSINGLVYGNGCLKLWPVAALLEMQPQTGFRPASGYFIDSIRYARQPEVFSETVPNASPEQAFVYGFREVYRSCVEGGWAQTPGIGDPRPGSGRISGGKRHLIRIICTAGSDVESGIWANLGGLEAIRYGLAGGAWGIVGDYDSIGAVFERCRQEHRGDAEAGCRSLVREVNSQTDLDLDWLSPRESAARRERGFDG